MVKSTMGGAQPPLEFIPPQFNPVVYWLARWLLPHWMRLNTSVRQVEADRLEILVELYRQFQAGQARFLMAFRHPTVDDPFTLACLIHQLLPAAARQQSVKLRLPHCHFIYDRGIPLWAGKWVGWVYSRLGGTPIQRGKLDRVGLKSVRELFATGRFPIAAAPEGATNGHNELISPLEPGIAQMGFWCVEDLAKAGQTTQVFIVPIGLQYQFTTPPWTAMSDLLATMEADLGIKSPGLVNPDPTTVQASLYQRLFSLGERLLSLMENFYSHYYHVPLEAITVDSEATSANQTFAERLTRLLDIALKVSEDYFDLEARGTVIDRCRRLEQAAWDWIYREDLKNPETLSWVERKLADRIAAEAEQRIWHMRLVESFVAVTGHYVLERPTAERFADTLLLTWETVTRIHGGRSFPRPRLGTQRARITIGDPINVTQRWQATQTDRRAAKQAVADLTSDLQAALQRMII